MADNLEDGEFWLPPQFLTDDEDFTSDDPDSDDDSLSRSVLSTSPKSTLCGYVGKDDSTLNKPAGVKETTEAPPISGTGFFDCRSKLPSCPPPTKTNTNTNTYTHFNSHPHFPPFSQQMVWGKMKSASGLLGLPPNAWPPLKPHNHHRPPPVMFPPLIRESVGTGVFLPRTVPSTTPPPPETRKKTEANGKKKNKSGKGQAQQPKNLPPSSTANENEIQLPQEWTY